jgi:hypothetical protein
MQASPIEQASSLLMRSRSRVQPVGPILFQSIDPGRSWQRALIAHATSVAAFIIVNRNDHPVSRSDEILLA